MHASPSHYFGIIIAIAIIIFILTLAAYAAEPVRVGSVATITLESTSGEAETSRWQRLLKFLQLRSIGVLYPEPGTVFTVTAVAYSSNVSQTDATPCITAAGTRVRRGIIATNFLPLGTKIKINGKDYVVEDRMNTRYNGQYIIDVWHPSTAEALVFGRQKLTIEIVELPTKNIRKVAMNKPTASPSLEPSPAAEETITNEESNPTLFARLRNFSETISRALVIRVATPDANCE